MRSSGLLGSMKSGRACRRAAVVASPNGGMGEPQGLAEVEGHRLERARLGQHRGPAARQGAAADQDVGHVAELLERVHHHHAGMPDLGAHHLVVAGDGPGVGRRRGARRGARAGVEEDQPLALPPRAAHQPEEAPGIPELLDDQGHDGRPVVVEDVLDEVLHPAHRLVAGGDGERHPELPGGQADPQHRGHGPALGDDGHAAAAGRSGQRRGHEGQGHAIEVVHRAQAVGPQHHHAGTPGEPRQLGLLGPAGRAALGEPRREDDDRAHAAPGAAAGGLQHARARDGEHGAVDTLRQLVHGGDAGPARELAPARVHEVDGPGEPAALQVGEHVRSERSRRRRGANHRDRPGAQEPLQGATGPRRPAGRRSGHRR